MVCKYSMSTLRKARSLILAGKTVKEVSDQLKIPASTIRSYTKWERERMGLTKPKSTSMR